jgi:hypothetical protein
MTALPFLILGLLVATVLIAGALRRVVRDESALETRLRATDTPAVSFVVPEGVDPADLRAALGRGGFDCVVATSGTHQCLHVQCHEADRARVRRLLEEAHDASYDGTELDLHPVVFEDETP